MEREGACPSTQPFLPRRASSVAQEVPVAVTVAVTVGIWSCNGSGSRSWDQECAASGRPVVLVASRTVFGLIY